MKVENDPQGAIRFRSVIESMQDAVITMDRNGLITFFSPSAEKMFGYSAEEVTGRELHGLLAPDIYRELFEKGFESFRRTGLGVMVGKAQEMEGRRKDGSVFPVELTVSSFHADGGWNAAGVLRDLTGRKELELELIEAREKALEGLRARTDILANMSHELRTPLNAVIGSADLLWETDLNLRQRNLLRVCRNAGENLLRLIADILDFARIEAGEIELEAVPFDLHRLIGEICESAGIRAGANGIELEQSISDETPAMVIGDPTRVGQVLGNLVNNAVKFTDRGRVTVDVSTPEPGVVAISVKDTGMGIPPDKLETIFESFVQADPSLARKYGGTGLGLAISRDLARLMNGNISVESVPGMGSEFVFTCCLPEASEAGMEMQFPMALPENLNVLLADDSPENRLLVLSFLEELNWRIETAGNGREALEMADNRSTPYDLVLMDMQMPLMDGYQAARAIRTAEAKAGRKRVPIAALTAGSGSGEKERCLEAGCDVYISKPIGKKGLLHAIYGLLKLEDRPFAEVPMSLEPLIPGYLLGRRRDVETIREMLKNGDFSGIEELAHKIKGTGGGYGFPGITGFGEIMERAARASDPSGVQGAMEKLLHYLGAVRIEYVEG